MPRTKLGKWSVGLHIFFLIAIIASIFLAQILKVLNFDDHWWDVTVPIVFSASIIAFIIGIIAKRKYQDGSISVLLSILLGLCVILFIIFHSLFITD
ncbi:MAG: hypothetical protein Q8P66_02330 [Candidatus Colwellbacteria bacterium]|nr:hypothetical protein [Candidatus Colwellbacteria bacterium]